MILTTHFDREEFELEGQMPDECVLVYTLLCNSLLEKIRGAFGGISGTPIEITSGYRSVVVNEKEHGVENSQHVATSQYCAADFKFVSSTTMRPAFDWIRLKSNLVWDQLILEHGEKNDIIHISITLSTNRREALEGKTANQSAYVRWPVTQVSA